MNGNELPDCLCGAKSWNPKGGSFSPTLNQYNFWCPNCERYSIFMSNGGGNVLLMFPPKNESLPDDVVNTWMNDVLLPTWRDCKQRLEEARVPIEDRWWNYACDEIDVPHGTTYDKVPEDRKEQWGSFWDTLKHYSLYRTPGEAFKKPVIPPLLPEGLTAYLLVEGRKGASKWEKVDPEESLSQVVPPDPIRVKHDAFYEKVFTDLKISLGIDFTIEHVPNEYCGAKVEPWFKFTLGENTLTVGPRKRVTAIKVNAPKGISTEVIRAAAMEVETTYVADGKWKENVPRASTLEVHAWDEVQLLSFLTIIGLESLGTPVS